MAKIRVLSSSFQETAGELSLSPLQLRACSIKKVWNAFVDEICDGENEN